MNDAAEDESESRTLEAENFESIVSHHQQRIYRTVLFIVRDADSAETLTQECFLRAFRMRRSFRGESSVSTWLVRIAINLAHDHMRNRRITFWRRLTRGGRTEIIGTPDSRRSAEKGLIDSESVRIIWSTVQKLSRRQRTVFQLRFIEDMPLEAIAQALGLELGTVKAHLHRATEAVKDACRTRQRERGERNEK